MKVLKSLHNGALLPGWPLSLAETHKRDYQVVEIDDPAPAKPAKKKAAKKKAAKKKEEPQAALPDDGLDDLLAGLDGDDDS